MHAPEWTNVNSSDPGITLLELCAFVLVALLFVLALKRRRTTREGR